MVLGIDNSSSGADGPVPMEIDRLDCRKRKRKGWFKRKVQRQGLLKGKIWREEQREVWKREESER